MGLTTLASRSPPIPRYRSAVAARPPDPAEAARPWRLAPVFAALVGLSACASPAPEPPAAALPPTPVAAAPFFSQTGTASWYGRSHQGRPTASGETFDMNRMTAAHRTLPFDTVLRVTNLRSGQETSVRVNDRGPFGGERIIDLSAAAAQALGMRQDGIAPVRIEAYAADQPAAAESTARR
jgi:peptidoglycan lytic transglycosylase